MLDNETSSSGGNNVADATNDGSRSATAMKSAGASQTVATAAAIPETTISAATEIEEAASLSTHDPVGHLIVRSNNIAQGKSVFATANAHVYEALEVAYPTYLLIKDDKREHQRVIDALMSKGSRERMPSLKKAAYNATVLACHPENPEEYSNCSDWQNVILLADIEKVPPDSFATWVKDKKIGESKRKVRASKQGNRRLRMPFTESELPLLTALFKQCNNDAMRQLVKEALTDFEKRLG